MLKEVSMGHLLQRYPGYPPRPFLLRRARSHAFFAHFSTLLLCCFYSASLLQEKCRYQLQITFRVQHEIVSGLKYVSKFYKAGIRVAKVNAIQFQRAHCEPWVIGRA